MALQQQIKAEGGTHLGVPTGIVGSSFALTKLTAIKNDPGYVVSETSIREWRFEGFTRIDGEAFLYGPDAKGRPLAEILREGTEVALPAILQVARALALLSERQIPTFRFQTEGVLLLEGGAVLFLPPNLLAQMKDSRPLEYRLEAYEAVNHPYVSGEEGLSFSLAAMSYRALTGKFPFMDETEQGLRNRIRRLRITPPHLIRPEIREEVSELVMRGLTKPASVSLAAWVERLEEWQKKGPLQAIGEGERAELLAKAKDYTEKAQRGFRSSVFLERNGRLLLIVAAAVVVAGFVVGSILKNALAPRVTRGFTPEQVVEAFYTSIGKLDHATMEDCVIGNAGKAEINEAVNLFVISRQQIAYEGKSYIIDAHEWDLKGRPAVSPPSFVNGVTNLNVVRERGEPEPIFLVKYERYARAFEDQNPENTPPVNGRRVTDRVYLTQNKGDWVIYRIDRLRVEPLD